MCFDCCLIQNPKICWNRNPMHGALFNLSPLSCQPMAGYFGGGHPTGGVQVQVQDTEFEFPRSWGLKWWFYCIETRFGECICSRSGGW